MEANNLRSGDRWEDTCIQWVFLKKFSKEPSSINFLSRKISLKGRLHL
jgi:hypothetical protein